MEDELQPQDEPVVDAAEAVDEPVDAVSAEPVSGGEPSEGAAPIPGSAAPAPTPDAAPQPAAKDWYEQLGAMDLSNAPAGAGMPMSQVAQMHRDMIAAQREAQEAQAALQSMRSMFGQQFQPQQPQQPQYPKWYNPQAQQHAATGDPEIDQFFGQQQQAQFDPGAFYADWQQQQQQVQQMHQQMQQFQRYIGQMQQQQLLAEVGKSFPDVPHDAINLALAQGLDVNAFAASMQAHINEIRAAAMKPSGAQLSVVQGGAPAPAPAPAAPRPSHVPGKGSAADNKPWNALPKTNPEAWSEAAAMMEIEGMSVADIQTYQPQLWRRLNEKKAG